jgi:hypothetical protein
VGFRATVEEDTTRVDPTMADTVNPTGPRKRTDLTQDDQSRLEALTWTYQARDRVDTPDRWPRALSPGSVRGPYRIVAWSSGV